MVRGSSGFAPLTANSPSQGLARDLLYSGLMRHRLNTASELGLILAIVVAMTGCDTTGMIYAPPCSGHGEDVGGSGTCACDDGYTGATCDECAPGFQDNDGNTLCSPDCASAALSCPSIQHCDDSTGIALCSCEDGYDGDDCLGCAVNYQDNDSNGSCEPACSHAELGCSDHGSCSDASGQVSCNCDPGYQGDNCNLCAQTFQDNDNDGECTADCSHTSVDCNNGSCSAASGAIVCSCESEYTGPQCDECNSGYQDNDNNQTCLATCATVAYTCSNKGSCSDASGEARCICDEGLNDDGAGHCISTSFIVTLVEDGLDPTDGELMKQGLLALGWAEHTWDRNVSSSELVSYLESPVTLVYHTGHGNNGSVMTSNGSIGTSSATIAATNTIFATCLTLSDTGWKNSFGSTAQTVMGYTQVSYDGPDDDVVETYVDELGAGRTHLQAWYLSNSSVSSLSDRWAAYSRDGSGIVEYSARTGNNPALATTVQWVEPLPGTNVRATAELLAAPDYSASYARVSIARTDVLSSQVGGGDLGDWLTPTTRSPADAVQIATNHLSTEKMMPADALFDRVVTIYATASANAGANVVGHTVYFGRDVAGLPVRGMGVADHIAVLVAGDQVVATTSYWPDLAVAASGSFKGRLTSVGDAIVRAAPAIDALLKQGVRLDLVAAIPVYGSLGPYSSVRDLVPAYELVASDGSRFVVDAVSGRLLR